MKNKYSVNLTNPKRFETREVNIGDIPLGGNYPIRVQSMTTTDTMDTIATVKQTIRMAEAGCEYVRITAPSIKEAKNLLNIKNELKKRGYYIPLIADIHYTPNAAEVAARIVEKIRINPGNFVDKKKFQTIEYTDREYEEELERVREKFIPLIKICKEYGTAMRIGANHGSLSDRIMSRYGDTPLGMVESALEFVRICEEENFHDIVLSMKSSNPKVMIQAYRLLVNKMISEGMNYPLHLGVTEAGEGEDGRIKSAMGIGALLEDGLGDTIRVSLTEPPENEIPVAKMLISRYADYTANNSVPDISEIPINPFEYERRKSFEVFNIGGGKAPKVVLGFSKKEKIENRDLEKAGYFFDEKNGKWKTGDLSADFIFIESNTGLLQIPPQLNVLISANTRESTSKEFRLLRLHELDECEEDNSTKFVLIKLQDVFNKEFQKIANKKNIVLVAESDAVHPMIELRRLFFELKIMNVNNPVIIKINYRSLSCEELQLFASTDFGALFADGFGDGIWITSNNPKCKTGFLNSLSFGILQAARVRITRTEYIACPSCGRTLFDLVEVTRKIRSKTEHLKGVKIGIMGCIVNGPGEMADADYGYVGSGMGRITLYRGKEIVKRNIPESSALDELIELIKNDGRWTDKNEINLPTLEKEKKIK